MSCCGAEIVELVQGDTKPVLQLMLYDSLTNAPFDVSQAGTTVNFLLKPVGANKDVKAVLECQKLPGTVGLNGVVSYPAQYSVAGSGGRVEVHWTPEALDTAGQFVGKVQILWNDGTKQTMVDDIKVTIDPAWTIPTP